MSVLILFTLTLATFPHSDARSAFTAAALHILSPAGIFLSAPFAESSCALLSFTGCLVFVQGFSRERDTTAYQDLLVICSGMMFGVATTFRSNGILFGLLFLEEAIRTLLSLTSDLNFTKIRRLTAVGLGGLSVAFGFLLPQYIAYNKYCLDLDPSILRPWCNNTVPSIYTFVQHHYWYSP
jgi:phosphatidylinositol glycan class V